MSLAEFRNIQAETETKFETHPCFNALIPTVIQMYQSTRQLATPNFSAEMGKLLTLSYREFLVAAFLLQRGLPFDAAANTRRAIEIARLALAVKRDPANWERWKRTDERQARWNARMEGARPKHLESFTLPDEDKDPLFASLKLYFGIYSDTYIHFTPEFVGQQYFDETIGERGKTLHLRWMANDRTVLRHALSLCGLHNKILLIFDTCFDNIPSQDKGWQLLKATLNQLGLDLHKTLPAYDEDIVN